MQKFPVEELREWFLTNRREFPWRGSPSPYEVWVSEVMLQQTQAAVVIPYFLHWMREFPDIEALARAPLEKVIKIWEGLGYYSRARHLHEGAKYVLEKHGAVLPDNEEELKKIKGLGPYTIGAILSFAFHKKKMAVDANVKRVLSRYFCDEKIRDVLPNAEPYIIMEGLIELGALVCKKKPLCLRCPLQEGCLAYKEEKTDAFPKRAIKDKTIVLYRHVTILTFKNEMLVCKQGPGVMADLYEFPYFEQKENLKKQIEGRFGLKVEYEGELERVCHTFTKYRAHLHPTKWRVVEKIGEGWVAKNELHKLPFSSGHRKILKGLSW